MELHVGFDERTLIYQGLVRKSGYARVVHDLYKEVADKSGKIQAQFTQDPQGNILFSVPHGEEETSSKLRAAAAFLQSGLVEEVKLETEKPTTEELAALLKSGSTLGRRQEFHASWDYVSVGKDRPQSEIEMMLEKHGRPLPHLVGMSCYLIPKGNINFHPIWNEGYITVQSNGPVIVEDLSKQLGSKPDAISMTVRTNWKERRELLEKRGLDKDPDEGLFKCVHRKIMIEKIMRIVSSDESEEEQVR